jgi:hypothetical protein
MKPPSSEIEQALAHHAGSEKDLNVVREKAQEARELELEVQSMEETLAGKKKQLEEIYFSQLPDLMDQAGVDRVGLPALGNLPPMDATLVPYYRANIAANWPESRRQEAFEALTEFGHEDLIKTELTIFLPRERRAFAEQLAAQLLRNYDLSVVVRESVHHVTLTAWLKEQMEGHKPLPPLDVIGAQVGRVVRLKERKE